MLFVCGPWTADCGPVLAAQVTLQWDANGAPDLAGYKAYYGTSSGNYQYYIDVGKQTTCTVPNLADGQTYYFSATAYDTSQIESEFSAEISYTTSPAPAPPPVSCTYSLSPVSQSFTASGGAGTVTLATQVGCTWTATSNSSWLILTSNSSGTGGTTLNFSVLANTGSSSRTGSLLIAGKTFAVSQGGVPQYTLTLAKTGNGSGTVSANPSETSYKSGTVVTLTAAADSSSTFAGWSGACTGTSSTCAVTMNANLTATATFNLKTYTITATAGANGSISPQGTRTINYGAGQTFTITPNAGYRVADLKVDAASVGAINSYTFTNVTANHTIQASFTPITYALTITKAGTGAGKVTTSPSATTFSAGTVVTLTAAADANSTFAGWSGACTGTSPTCTVTMNANTSVTATFTAKTYAISAAAGANGSISPQGSLTVNHGSNQSFTISPSAGYKVADVKVDGLSIGAVNSYTFTNVIANHTIQASFTSTTYTLTITKAGTGTGNVTTNPSATTFSLGTVATLTAAADASSTFAGWSGACTGTSPTCTVTMNANLSATATFNLKTFTITATAGTNGSISPQGSRTVNYSASQSFTIAPNTGYRIADVKVDGGSVGAVSSYNFTNATANHTIQANFTAIPSTLYTLNILKAGTGTGSIVTNPSGNSFSAGTTVTLTATPDFSSTFSGWSGGCTGTASTCTLTMNSDLAVTATFTIKSYTIRAAAGPNGSISPQGATTINHGSSQTFTITPGNGSRVNDVKADAVSIGPVTSYTFGNVTTDHSIEAIFAADPSGNLLSNGGFETGNLSPWKKWGGYIRVDPKGNLSGHFGLKMASKGQIEQWFPTTIGKTYYVSARIRIDRLITNPSWGGLAVRIHDARLRTIGGSPYLAPDNSPLGSWTRVDFAFIATSTHSSLIFQNLSKGQFEASADDFIVSPNPIP